MPEKLKEPSVETIAAEGRWYGISPEQAKLLHRLITKRRFPSTVRGLQLKFGEDSTSDPALWVIFLVDNDLMPSDEKIAELNNFATEVSSDLIQQHLPVWPYVSFRAANERDLS